MVPERGEMAGGPREYAGLQTEPAVPQVRGLLKAGWDGKFQLYPGEKNCPLVQNLNLKGKSAPCVTWS